MTDLWTELKESKNKVYVYGTGNGADKLFEVLNAYGIQVSGVFVSDGFVRDKSYRGFKICSYDEISKNSADFIVLTAFGSNRQEVIENIKRIAAERQLYAPDLPVYGDQLFNAEFYAVHQSDIEFVRSRLSDSRSVYVFENILNYKLSGKIDYLFDCQSDRHEVYENILKPSEREIYIDLGAYRGDTVAEFLEYAGGYAEIYAVEPDKKSYDKLAAKYSDYKNIFCINAAAGCGIKDVKFQFESGRGSHISDMGMKVASCSVDGILNGSKATVIKMDVEGSESNAVAGAAQTILRYKPRLQIAAYHRSEDIFSIVRQVLNIRDDYRVFMRHHPYIPAWDTDYYFI